MDTSDKAAIHEIYAERHIALQATLRSFFEKEAHSATLRLDSEEILARFGRTDHLSPLENAVSMGLRTIAPYFQYVQDSTVEIGAREIVDDPAQIFRAISNGTAVAQEIKASPA